MPSQNELLKFKEILNQLGNEPQILQERGESIEDIPFEEGQLDSDVNDLISGESGSDDLSGIFNSLSETQEEAGPSPPPEMTSEDFSEPSIDDETDEDMSLPGDQMDFSDFEFQESENDSSDQESTEAEDESSSDLESEEDTPDFGNILPEDFSVDMDTINDIDSNSLSDSTPGNSDEEDEPFEFTTDDLDFSLDDEETETETAFPEENISDDISESDKTSLADELNLDESAFSLDEDNAAALSEDSDSETSDNLDSETDDINIDSLGDDLDLSVSEETFSPEETFDLSNDLLSGLYDTDESADVSGDSDDDFMIPEQVSEASGSDNLDNLLEEESNDFQPSDDGISPDTELNDDFSIPDDFNANSSDSDFDSAIGDDDFAIPDNKESSTNDFSSDFGEDDSFSLPSELDSDLGSGDLGDSGFGSDLDDNDAFSLPDDFNDDQLPDSDTFNLEDSDDFEIPADQEASSDNQDFGPDDNFSFDKGESAEKENTNTPEDDLSIDDDFSIPDEFSIDEDSFGDSFDIEEGQDSSPTPKADIPSAESSDGSIEIEADDEDLSDFGSEIDDIGEFSLPDEFADASDSSDEEIDFSVPEGEDNLDSMTGLEDSSGSDEIDEFSLPDEFSMPDSFGDETLSGTRQEESSESEGDEFLLDEFSLPEMGSSPNQGLDSMDDQFGGGSIPEATEAVPPGEEDIQISDTDFGRIQQTLISLPRQLKILVQDLIGQSRIWGEDLDKLLNLLTKGAAPQAIADFVSALTGEKIVLPKGFEKKTGLDFEREKRSFAYVFKENIIPMLRILLPVAFLVFLLVLGAINLLVYINAQNHYQRGIVLITEEKQPDMGNEEFRIAQEGYYDKNWYYRYAEAFIQEKNYQYAREKYEELLGILWEDNKILYISNPDKKALLDYAGFESRELRNHPKAEILYKALLNEETFHAEGLLGHGDNYMEWAKKDASKYENARNAYAEYRSRYGDTDDVYFRFLRYFIRTDQFQVVRDIKNAVQANEKRTVDPEVYTELGKYLIDKGALNDVRAVLDRSLKEDFNLPQSHYQLARYFKIMEDAGSEETALKNTRNLLENQGILALDNLKMYIDSLSRLGDLYYKQGKELDSLRELNNAIKIIEDRQEKRIINKEPDFGKVYYTLGNIFYDNKDFEKARDNYSLADENHYKNPEMNYKKGYIAYWNEDYETATLEFHDTEEELQGNRNTMFALANSLYFQGHYNAAQGYYNHILNLLEQERERIPLIRPNEFPDHASLLSFMYAIYNNLGVTLYRLSQESPNPRRESQALVYLTKSMETSDILDRLIYSPELMERSPVGAKDNPGLKRENREYQNQRAIVHESKNFELQLYKKLPIDAHALELPETASEFRVQ